MSEESIIVLQSTLNLYLCKDVVEICIDYYISSILYESQYYPKIKINREYGDIGEFQFGKMEEYIDQYPGEEPYYYDLDSVYIGSVTDLYNRSHPYNLKNGRWIVQKIDACMFAYYLPENIDTTSNDEYFKNLSKTKFVFEGDMSDDSDAGFITKAGINDLIDTLIKNVRENLNFDNKKIESFHPICDEILEGLIRHFDHKNSCIAYSREERNYLLYLIKDESESIISWLIVDHKLKCNYYEYYNISLT